MTWRKPGSAAAIPGVSTLERHEEPKAAASADRAGIQLLPGEHSGAPLRRIAEGRQVPERLRGRAPRLHGRVVTGHP